MISQAYRWLWSITRCWWWWEYDRRSCRWWSVHNEWGCGWQRSGRLQRRCCRQLVTWCVSRFRSVNVRRRTSIDRRNDEEMSFIREACEQILHLEVICESTSTRIRRQTNSSTQLQESMEFFKSSPWDNAGLSKVNQQASQWKARDRLKPQPNEEASLHWAGQSWLDADGINRTRFATVRPSDKTNQRQ